MINQSPSIYLVYEGNNIKVISDFKEVKSLIDFNECSRKLIPSPFLDLISAKN